MYLKKVLWITLAQIFWLQSFASDTRKVVDDNLLAHKPLTLSGAIEQGLRENFDQKRRTFERSLLEFDWRDTRDSFWLPTIGLTLQSNEQRIARLKRGRLNEAGTTREANGSLSLSLGEYTVFNWGRDYLDYLNGKGIFKRGVKRLSEERRELRFQIIGKYFEVDYLKKIKKIYRTRLRHAAFVYRFSREKIALRKIGKQEYYQARGEYLEAQDDFREATRALENAIVELSQLIIDPAGTKYVLKNTLSFRPLSIPRSGAISLLKKNNPSVLENTQLYTNSKRSYKRAQLDNLPLPTFTIDLGAYTQSFADRVNSFRYRNGSGNHLDLVAQLNASWTITGSGGFLNGRTLARSRIARDLASNSLAQAEHIATSQMFIRFDRIKNYEGRIPILKTQVENNNKTFDLTLDNYLDRKSSFLNYQTTLEMLVDSEIDHATVLYSHLVEKLELAEVIGLDEFPGESFEELVTEAVP